MAIQRRIEQTDERMRTISASEGVKPHFMQGGSRAFWRIFQTDIFAIDNQSQLRHKESAISGCPWMIICVCNRLNDKQVRAAILSGASCPDSVYAKCGVERNCGRCQDEIEMLLDEEKDSPNPAQAA